MTDGYLILLTLGEFFVFFLLLRILVHYPVYFIYILLSLLVLGEFGRVHIPFIEPDILLLDLFVLAFGLFYIGEKWITRKKIILGRLSFSFFCFICTALISLLLQWNTVSWVEWFGGFAYLVRFCSYFIIYIIALNEHVIVSRFIVILCIASFLLAFLGFIQLLLFPDFTFMYDLGWDPHRGRLLSTWFDPNFIGGFFSYMIILFVNLLFYKQKRRIHKIFLCFLIAVLLIALIFTFSRSSYLMLLIGLFFTGIFRSPKILICGTLLFLLLMFVPRVQERSMELFQSTLAYVTNSYDYSLDETARLRTESWQQALELWEKQPLLGIGYNTMRYRKLNSGQITDLTIHSGAGSDSSLLTILVTTGVIGFVLYCIVLVRIITLFPLKTCNKNTSSIMLHFATGFRIAFMSLLIHSLFVNSLVFPYYLTIIYSIVGTIESYTLSQEA